MAPIAVDQAKKVNLFGVVAHVRGIAVFNLHSMSRLNINGFGKKNCRNDQE